MFPALLQAGLEFKETELEIQAGLLDEKIEAVFSFRNTGPQAISISNMRSSCGCTVPTLDKNVYEPGEGGEIKALFTIGGRTGVQHKTVSLTTNDPDNPTVLLSFTTTIPEWCTITPRLLRWTKAAEISSLQVTLTLPDPEKVKIELTGEGLKNFTVTEVSNTPERRVYKITPNTTVERVTEKLSFKMTATDGDRKVTRDSLIYCLIR